MKRILIAAVFFGATAAVAHDGEPHAPPAKKPTATPAAAGHDGDHEHASPHGGIVATVDKELHVEALFSEQDVSVWFYNAEMELVALPADAKATIVVGKEVKKLDLPVVKKPDGRLGDHLHATLATAKDQKVAMVIQATVAGKARTVRVERAPSTPAPKK